MVLHYSSGFILRFHYTGEYFAKLQARAWLSHALCSPGQHTAESLHDTTTFLFVTLLNIYRFYFFTGRLSNKPFLIWLLTISPHLKYAATLRCNRLESSTRGRPIVASCFSVLNTGQLSRRASDLSV